MRRWIAPGLLAALLATASAGLAQTNTPTSTPTHTPTHTPTSTPTLTPTLTPTRTPAATHTPNNTLLQRGERLTGRRLSLLEDFSPAGKAADLGDIVSLGVRQVRLPATNATALGLTDVGTVTSILAFTASSGAAATKALLVEGTDFTVSGGDITPAGDASTQLWVITYRP